MLCHFHQILYNIYKSKYSCEGFPSTCLSQTQDPLAVQGKQIICLEALTSINA